ncbi:hypothetical protein HPSA20_1313 [Helicobacter pylori SouthAfrica20]|uniref:Uncharacterized protein n=1 Tax=Helicobacter pylori SouthAfrica20 TaxID=1352356 RepID=T1UB59_HELPX|nr:hypothetical protein HPSA20_1313 [Helicobacter pylori SouthAfrica20]
MIKHGFRFYFIVKPIFLKELEYFGIIPPNQNPLTLKSAF